MNALQLLCAIGLVAAMVILAAGGLMHSCAQSDEEIERLKNEEEESE